MKRLILSLLVFVMLLPGMACADIMQYARAVHPAADKMDCCPQRDHASGGVMLFKDCARADLQTASDGPMLKKPVFAKDMFLPLPQMAATSSFARPVARQAQGPPLIRLTTNITHPPLLLSVPRLRI